MTDELKQEILQLIKDTLSIEITKDSDYYGNYTTYVTLNLFVDGKYEKICTAYD